MLFPQFLNANVVTGFVRNMGNRIFTVVFERTDGVRRTMNCRLHVRKNLRTPVDKTKPKPAAKQGVLVVFDLKANGYRSFRVDKVFSIQTAGAILAPKTKFRKPRAKKQLAAVSAS